MTNKKLLAAVEGRHHDRKPPYSRKGKTKVTHDEAIAAGYKDETCPRCGTFFKAEIHFVPCEADPCPMISTKDSRTLLQRFVDGD